MGLFSFLRNRFALTETEREYIFKVFGSFTANKFSLNGTSIIENSFNSNVDVYSVIKKIIDVQKSVDWIVEEKQRDGTWKELTDTTIHELMEAPNSTKGYTWNDVEEQLLTYLLTTGNAYLIGSTQFNSRLIEEVDILPSNYVCVEANHDFFLPEINYRFQFGRTNRLFKGEEVAHIKFFNPASGSVQESVLGLSPIEVAARVVQVGNDRWDADANLLQNRGAIGLVTDRSQRPMTAEESQRVDDDFNRKMGGSRNFGKIKVTNKDLNYIQMAMSPTDLQLIEKGVVNLRAICNVFGLDSSLFNDPANKTFNNRLEAEKSLYTNVVVPLSDKVSEHFNRFIVKNHFPNKNVRMRQNFDSVAVLQRDLKAESDAFVALKNAGIITANEAREGLKYDALPDLSANSLGNPPQL